MGVNIITQFRTKNGRCGELIALISRVLPESLEHEGCMEVCIRQNQEDPNDIISVQRWASRRHYESYRAWRTANGVTAAIEGFLTEPIGVRYFDDVQMHRAPNGAGNASDAGGNLPEIAKIGSADALGG